MTAAAPGSAIGPASDPATAATAGWIIAAAELRIPWSSAFAAHRMIILAEPTGEMVRQLNGLASSLGPTGWRHKPIGYLPSDRLRGYDSKAHPETLMPVNGVWPGRSLKAAIAKGAVQVLADGLEETTAARRLAPALEALARINGLSPGPGGGSGLPYPFLGFGANSNSLFSTLLAVMGFKEPSFAAPALLVPGAGGLVLSLPEIEEIRRRHEGGTSGPRKSVSEAAIASTPLAVG
jgi:hypothetical protein